jgi:hypothetical protein
MPRALALFSIACSCVILFHGIRKRVAAAKEADREEKKAENEPAFPFTPHPLTAGSAMVLVFFYILALDLGISGFRTITMIFVLVLGGVLIKAEKGGAALKKGIILFLLALSLSFGLFYLFTRVFIVDLY